MNFINTKTATKTALASGLALALAACGDDAEEPIVENETADMQVNETADYDPMTRDYTLSEEARARRDAYDTNEMHTEYRTFRDEITGEQVNTGGTNATAEAGMSEEDRAESEAAARPRDADTNMRTRQNMTFGYLDRNDDGKLSVAEYAIWAIPLDPQHQAMNDQGQPELKADTANKAADSFFYYDVDGDTFLDQREFTSARRGETIGS
ncbi:MAG: hypothetical protein ACR2FJ_04615 [Qipengyuania sp.]